MGFGYIITGFFFLMNPVVHLLDFLPDWIGWLLIGIGLRKTAFMADKLAEAKTLFNRLLCIDAVRFAAILLWPTLSDMSMLLVVFLFTIAECVFLFPAVQALFDGMQTLALLHNGTAVVALLHPRAKNANNRKREAGSAWRTATFLFLGLRLAATLLPELTALQMYDTLGSVHRIDLRYADYKPMLYVLLSAIVLIAGAAWYIHTFRYWNGIRKDRVFVESLRHTYETEILPNTNLFCALSMRKAGICLAAASVVSVSVILDGVNILPGCMAALLLMLAAVRIGKSVRIAYAVLPICLLRMGMAIWNLMQQIQYFSEYTEVATEWIPEAYDRYYFLAATTDIEQVLAVAAVLLLYVAYLRAIRIHLAQTGIQTESVQYSKQRRDQETYSALRSKLLINAAICVLQAVGQGMYLYLLPDVPFITLVTTLLSLGWMAHTIYTVSAIYQLVYKRMAGDY